MALTKVTGQVIKNTTDVTVGVLTVTNTLAVGGTVSIGGTLTYEDVTNVDAVGLITARNGIVVGSGITLSKDGDGFFTGVVTATSYRGDGSNLTGIDLSAVTGATGDFSIADKIVHTGDTDTAIRFSGADTFTVETGGVQRLRIDSTGDVRFTGTNLTDSTNKNVNLTVPSYDTDEEDVNIIQVENESSTNQISFGGGTSGLNAATKIRFLTASAANTVTGTEKFSITSDGVSLANGADATTSKLILALGNASTKEATIQGTSSSTNEKGITFKTFSFSAKDALTLTPAGLVGINLTTPQKLLDVRGEFAISNSNTSYWDFDRDDSDGSLKIKDTGTERFRIATGGDVTVQTGNLVIATAGKGIDFSAATDETTNLAETVDASILDDYEEGQFTPAVQFDSGGGGISYGTRYGRYRKVGNMVTLTYYMEISSGVSSSDYFARLSLPFNGFGGGVGHQDARIRQWNTGYSDWFVSLGGSAPVFFHSNANGSSSNYARGDDINGYKLSGQVILYT